MNSLMRAHFDAATGNLALSPPAERGERVGRERDGRQAQERVSDTSASSPRPSPPKEERELGSSASGSVKRPLDADFAR